MSFTEAMDGLSRHWSGRVWLNPPFDRYKVGKWMGRMADHRNGIALLHARMETEWFRKAWEGDGMLFLSKRIHFCRQDGTTHAANSGAPVVLVAYGSENRERLANAGIRGVFVETWHTLR